MSPPLDFPRERDNETSSWTRADPDRALIERTSRYAYFVTLPDGHVHRCAYAVENGEYIGRCDCDGFRYHDGPCAHLCTLRKAEFGHDETTHGERIKAAPAGEDWTTAGKPTESFRFDGEEWAGLSLGSGEQWVSDAYFAAGEEIERSLRLYDDPLPEVEDAQTAAVTRLWGEMEESDRAVVDTLLADGGEVSPADAAEQTGYNYRTVRRVVDRLSDLIEHTYGQLEFASKHVQQKLLSRVQAAEQNFRETVGSAAMQVAQAAERGDTANAWSRWRREYNAAVRPGEYDHETRVEIHYRPTDAADERSMLRQLALAWEQTHDEPVRHLTVSYTRADGEHRRVRDT
ncbi:hypothetical protein U3A55_00385 [Salarchaeum sp. III]|uniref:hypothetical protein n=1 Tax=Salarchaeum sp. III TaxID=3107927 RepID=UPI002EDB7CDB